MKSGRLALAWLVVLLGIAGCKKSASQPPPVPATPTAVPTTSAVPAAPLPANQPTFLPYAQTNLQTIKLLIGTNELQTELAHTVTQIMTGMMWRTNMAEEAGMLFIFGQPHQAAFYMRNTHVPLSLAYIDPAGVIQEIHDLKPLDETSVPATTDQVLYVLEVNQGWFKRHNISPGAIIRTPYGTLKQTFVPRR